MQDPSFIGKNDDFGQLKYKLNLDENLVRTFYQNIIENKDILREICQKVWLIENDELEITALKELFRRSVDSFKNKIEDFIIED